MGKKTLETPKKPRKSRYRNPKYPASSLRSAVEIGISPGLRLRIVGFGFGFGFGWLFCQCLETMEQDVIRVGVVLNEAEVFLRQADVGPSADKQAEVWAAPYPIPLTQLTFLHACPFLGFESYGNSDTWSAV